MGDKIRGQEGNSPEEKLRAQSVGGVKKRAFRCREQSGGGLGSSRPLKKT